MKLRCAIDLGGLAGDGVERPTPGAAPVAFRIWHSGNNPTDKGDTVFTEQSAKVLIAEQEKRGLLYSIDVDHLSLTERAPPEARRAVGWHRLEVRPDAEGNPELWATNVEWTDVAKAGLEKSPPEWRYFSPAYDVSAKTREVVGYLNTALTNNPATWGVTALANTTAKEKGMTLEELIAALKALAESDDPDAAKAKAMLEALTPASDSTKTTTEETAADPPADGDDEAKKKKEADSAAADAIKASKGDEGWKEALALLEAKLAAKDAKIAEDAERTKLLASRADFGAELVTVLASAPIAVVREAVKKLPKVQTSRGGAAVTTETVRAATRGVGQVGDSDPGARAGRLPADEKAALDRRMGLAPPGGAIQRRANKVSFGVLSKDEAKRITDSRTGGAA